ncbi:amino acid adenylation domain-containing protein [Chitinophaga skermanii]|uniref:Amino acid adenylation domain-containing protein n=1 Tax=Chitinophaga skermanii TaxID=331697 RepID=A0A327R5A2_9BACT|nr:non-ribosomal peptide synthetase [Chitinophaga skermanii]RAJ11142.1 amino acid adenylation domain-containing protein [Chitinophaga skermanii]
MKIMNAFRASVAQNPERIALRMPSKTITYSELNDFVNNVLQQLQVAGVQKGDIVAIYATPGIEYIASILALQACEAVFLPLEPGVPTQRVSFILDQVKPVLVIATSSLPAGLHWPQAQLHLNGDQLSLENTVTAHTVRAESLFTDRLTPAYLFFTSGSTGTPKAIEGTVEGLDHFIRWESELFVDDVQPNVSLLAPLAFDVSLRDIFLPLYNGGTLCIPTQQTKQDIRGFLQWINENNLTHIHLVPSLFRLLTAEIQSNPKLSHHLATVKNIFLAGEPLLYKDVAAWRNVVQYDIQLVNLYGPSETSLAKLFYRIPADISSQKGIVPLGEAIAGAQVYIMKNGQICNTNEIGEISIQTKFRSNGYFADNALTNEKFALTNLAPAYGEYLYKSGDLAKLGEDGIIYFVGRQDTQVKINGNRVELSEVEKTLQDYPSIQQVIVAVHENTSLELEIAAYYVAADNIPVAAFQSYLSNILPTYMHPLHYIKMDKFPLNMNGKIDRKALPRPVQKVNSSDFAPCETPLEESIEAIWKSILKTEQVGRNAGFFTIGGSSLKAIQIISRMQKEFGVLVKLADFFAKPTVKDLAVLIEKASTTVHS